MKVYAPGTLIASRYEVASRPMMSGMGIVYICLDRQEDRPVALKTFKPEYLPDRAARDRFLREGTAWVELGKHPHIVRCYEVTYIDPTAFLVLELVAKEEGREDASLRSWLGQPLPLETALLFSLQIARGLAHAARELPGFVHRDLKPENVLVGTDKLPGTAPATLGAPAQLDVNRLRVTDFGLVAMLQGDDGQPMTDEAADAPTSSGQRSVVGGRTHLTRGIVGTPLYMAPEQWQGEPLGVYTDVYALGCILYEMLTGEYLVSGHSLAELRTAHCAGRPRPIPENLPSEVTGFLTRCLAREGRERYLDWEAVLAALEAACAELGVSLPAPQAEETSLAEQRDLASSYNDMGNSYLHLGNARVAMGYFEKALGIYREIGDRRGEGVVLGNLGIAYDNLGDARRAIGYYEQALKIHREIGNRRGEGATLSGLGLACARLGDTRRAIGYFEEHLEIAHAIGDPHGEGAALGNLGTAYLSLGDARRAVGYFEKHLRIACAIGNRRGEGNALGNLGQTYSNLGDLQRGLFYSQQALTVFREIGDRKAEGEELSLQGGIYVRMRDTGKAIECWQAALQIAKEIGDEIVEGNCSFKLAVWFAQQGNRSQALELAQRALALYLLIGRFEWARDAQQLVAQLQGGGTMGGVSSPA